jgi:hypothetical protein
MLKHGRAGVPMEVMGLVARRFRRRVHRTGYRRLRYAHARFSDCRISGPCISNKDVAYICRLYRDTVVAIDDVRVRKGAFRRRCSRLLSGPC